VGFKILSYLKFRCSAPVLKFEAGTMANLCKIKLCFNASGVDQHAAAAAAYVKIDHMPGLKEISAKIGAACAADAQSALKITVNNHPSNPRIDVQLLELMSKKLNEQDIDEVQEKLEMKLRTRRQYIMSNSFEHPMIGDVMQDIPSLCNARSVPIEPTRWKLAFQKPVQLPIFTGCKIQDDSGGPLQIILVDGDSGLPSALPQHLRINLFLLYANQVLDEAEDSSTADIHVYGALGAPRRRHPTYHVRRIRYRERALVHGQHAMSSEQATDRGTR